VPSREYYLRQARLLFDLAATSTDPDLAAQWVRRASEYQRLAGAMPHGDPTPIQVIQPQQQARDDDQP
jgi:hypothetical protein